MLVEHGAGTSAGFPDKDYAAKGATLAGRREVLAAADVLLQVRTAGANPDSGAADVPRRCGAGRSSSAPASRSRPAPGLPAWPAAGVTTFALELIPRITRAQSMDVLSSMATIAGYHAVLLAATSLPRMFPMLMTAAGTIAPAKVLVIGAGVAGLQAIATARRLGRQGRGLRRAARREGTGAEPGREVRRAAARNRPPPRTRAATRRPRTRRSTGSSASCSGRSSRPTTSSSPRRRSRARRPRCSSPPTWSRAWRRARSSSISRPSAAATAS